MRADAGPQSVRRRGLITTAIERVASGPWFGQAIARYAPEPAALPDLALTVAAIFAATSDFSALHMMTALHATRLLVNCIDADDRPAALRALWCALGATYCTLGAPPVPAGDDLDVLRTSVPESWTGLLGAAAASDDEHVIKSIFTAWREEAVYGDPIFRRAACAYAQRFVPTAC